ncbi:hypothetical protein GF336_04005 [Candidatus Woesearchaeota archaeon]|nr:hypothetical protein [Candidatus Woesearchaeota archaeon]
MDNIKEKKQKLLGLLVCIIFLVGMLPQNFAIESSYDLSYDENGNLIQDMSNYYEYNSLNQLIRVREGGSEGRILEEYFYDESGQRIKKITYDEDESSKTTYYIDKNYVREIDDSGEKDTVYYYDSDSLVGRKDPDGELYFYHPNHLGSTDIVTDSSGDVVEETEYLPFGEVLEGGDSRHLFTGQEKDQDTGLHYYNARYYSSFLRHFTQPDTMLPDIYDPQQLNRYSYARNNPVKYVDDSGHFVFTAMAIGFTAGAVISAGVSAYYQHSTTGSINAWTTAKHASIGGAAGAVGVLAGAAAAVVTAPIFATTSGVAAMAGYSSVGSASVMMASVGSQITANILTGNSLNNNLIDSAYKGALIGGTLGIMTGAASASYSSYKGNTFTYGNFGGVMKSSAKVSSGPSFSNKASLSSHFNKHGAKMGFKTAKSYNYAAKNFLGGKNPKLGTAQMIRPSDGAIVKYNPKTTEFGVLNADGTTIRTYFKPYDDPAKSYNYYLKQIYR